MYHLIFIVKIKIIMRICILGDGLSSLTLAKTLVNQDISVDVYSNTKNLSHSRSRTIGISKKNIEFFNNNVINIKKLLWKLNKIEIFTENLTNQKVLNFENKQEQLFSIVRNYNLYDLLDLSLKKNKLFKKLKTQDEEVLVKKNYDLIINCDMNHKITNRFFYKKIEKRYNSSAYTTVIKHKKITDNNTAIQIFTEKGPIAFLPISNSETSVVYSINTNNGKKITNVESLIKKYNPKYSILKINEINNFELKSSNLRSYFYKNFLAFGDLLHRIHPLAGQGFNMTIRDIKDLLGIIKDRRDLGLKLDTTVCEDFEKKTRYRNYIFSNGIDLLHEVFNLDRKIKNKIFSKSLQFLGKNKTFNKVFTKFADDGLII